MTPAENPPVSVKAALRSGDRWVLLRNDRDEWELPGGRVDACDNSLQDVVRRECVEELDLAVEVGPLLSSYLFEVVPGKRVTIVCFAACVVGDARPTISDEHTAVGFFRTAELESLALPRCYRTDIGLAEAALGPT